MTAEYPTNTKTFREKLNMPGEVYQAEQPYKLYVEDLTQVEEEVVAIEDDLRVNIKPDLTQAQSDITTAQGDISSLETGKEDALGFTPENTANKSTNTALGTSDTLFPTQKAVKTYIDDKITNVAFEARMNADQTLSTTDAIKVVFDVQTYDDGGDNYSTTNRRFTAPVAGYYLIGASLRFATPGDATFMSIRLYLNGTAIEDSEMQNNAGGTNSQILTFSRMVKLAQNDYLEIYASATPAGKVLAKSQGFFNGILLKKI